MAGDSADGMLAAPCGVQFVSEQADGMPTLEEVAVSLMACSCIGANVLGVQTAAF